ncbi:MAG: YegP family protein [Saprospiraceae bacterium]
MAKFEITRRKNGEFQFNLKASNGEVILTSEGYSRRPSCLNGIASVQKNSQEESRYDLNVAKNGKVYFNLKAINGQIIGKSQMYEDNRGRSNGMKSVMKNAPGAKIEDLSIK